MLQKNAKKKMQKKKKKRRIIFLQNPIKDKKNTPKNQTIPAASTAGPCPTTIGLSLRFYNNVQAEWQLCRDLSDGFLRSRLI